MDIYEKEAFLEGCTSVVGVDEAGRGPLAGPVVAAAVCFSQPLPINPLIRDSKSLSALQRSSVVFDIYRSAAAVGIGVVWHEEVDSINIHRASLLAMDRAVKALPMVPDMLLIDGKFRITAKIPQRPIVAGDKQSLSIAAASIIAKTTRDHIMDAYHKIFPEYGFARHKGYGTKAHLDALNTAGPSPVHRKTFKGVRR
jgi:ribonuclease HII